MRMQDQFSLNHCAHNAIMLTNTFFSRVPGSVEWIRNTTTTNLGSLTSRLFIRNKYHLTLLLSEEKDILSDVASFDDADLTIFNTEHLELSSESDSISSPLHHPTKKQLLVQGSYTKTRYQFRRLPVQDLKCRGEAVVRLQSNQEQGNYSFHCK